jgi:hypothetical protein
MEPATFRLVAQWLNQLHRHESHSDLSLAFLCPWIAPPDI